MKRDYIYIGLIVALVLTLFFMDRCGEKREAKLRNEIAEKSGMLKEADGRYSQLVTITNSTNSLVNELKGSLDGQFNDIKRFLKRNDERLLAFTTAYTSFRSQKDSILIFPADPTTAADWQFKLMYPDSANPFIVYDGLIFAQNRRITGGWKFNRLPLSFVLTETTTGNWNARVIGPDYFMVDSIITRALPADKISSVKRFGLVAGVGGGWNFDSDSPVFSLAVGMRIKKMHFLAAGSTRQDIQLLILRDF